MRSRTGCLTCRGRKLKCDEKRPKCGQCCKASRECIPSSGIVFRHQHNASMNGGDASDESSLKGFYAYKNTFDQDSVWLDIPKQVTFINTSNPYLDPATPDFDTLSVSSLDSPAPFEPLPNTSWPTSNTLHIVTSTPSSSGPDIIPTPRTSAYLPSELDTISHLPKACMLQTPPTSEVGTPTTPSIPLHQPFNTSVFESCMTPPPIDPRLSSPFELNCDRIPRSSSTSQPTSAFTSTFDPMSQQDHEIAFLLRWFSEGPGHWMDLFDLGTYFSAYVPVKAQGNPVLKYAAVAYSAKSLARMHGRKPAYMGDASCQSWMTKATQYYDTAVSLLLQAIKTESIGSPGADTSGDRSPLEYDSALDPDEPLLKRRRTSSNTRTSPNTDELLAATAILCVYEFLDASVPEWARHLSGAKSLLSIAQERMMPLQASGSPSSRMSSSLGVISKARRATFWNIARQDMLAAFINKSHTQLDTEDLQVWRDAGLLIDQNGLLLPNSAIASIYPERDGSMREDLICNALVWLMAKLVNFMAVGDELPSDFRTPWVGVSQSTLLDYWISLKRQFQQWHDELPVTFKPCARVNSSYASPTAHSRSSFSEVWYSIPMCGSTMQCYHMSQIQLLMNKPHESTQGRTTMFARLSSYQSILSACQVHSREIIGISLARSNDAVRIHSVQPLFTAGQCLSDPLERQVVLDLLRGIEFDIGWATDYRISQLREQWHHEESEHLHVP